ncbi:hypothetical protein TKK_0001437 [Trichogramma kaykai]|uniref:Uncharacterized protein n=1 Tax=Trichogramma kaykai TaxID=54128 RepID=A0ABD2X1Y5_9HYME
MFQSAENKDDNTLKGQNTSENKLTRLETQNGTKTSAADINKAPKKNSEVNKLLSEKATKTDIHKAHEAELRTMAGAHDQERKSLVMAEHIRRHGAKLDEMEMSRPKGAVISLALGLTVTAFMAVLIACRLRVVKRRGRGRGGEFSHDADYLVNGMYL